MNEVVNELLKLGKKVSTMESCTGGYIANIITNVEGSSEVFNFGAVTYSNSFKKKLGVSSEVILKYSVYSMETSMEMSKNISMYTNSNYGIGITGKLNRVDKENLFGSDNVVFVSIYDRDNNEYFNKRIEVGKSSRVENKEYIGEIVTEMMLSILKYGKL